jgi:glycosyltransferase involved in cell wall biosynthesis
MFALSDRRAPNSEQPVILAANNGFNRLKNTAKLIKAFDLVRREIPGAQLHLAGSDHGIDGPAEKWATERRLEHQVVFLGPVQQQELLGRMRAADLFVHPSRSESFGNVLVEAMAQGTPTIGGRRSGAVPWVLDEGRAGLLTDIQRPDVLAEAILSILRDPDRWVHYSEGGFRISKQRFSVDVVARQHADLLTSHLANASSR